MIVGSSKTRSILIAALGGEGGGVLSDWTIEAIRSAGFLVQGTSIPGVAQRTGATTYYIEYLPVPKEELGEERPVFALTPIPGRVDVMMASELIEAARAAEGGYVSPDRTTLIASNHRVYATTEKISMLDGRFDSQAALNAIHAAARRPLVFDMQSAALEAGTVINAVILGTLAGSNALGIDPELFEAAIKKSGKSVAASLKGYRYGFDAARGTLPAPPSPALSTTTVTRFVDAEFPVEARHIVETGYKRCLDYQDTAYAYLYLQRVRGVLATDRQVRGADQGWKLTLEAARLLALRMTYEDVIRVADLKTRADRFATVRRETRVKAGEGLRIIEYFKPGPEEICALLPPAASNALLRWLRKRGLEHRFNIALHVRSDTISGYLLMRLLARARVLRRRSWRFAQEEALTTRWLTAVKNAALLDYAFAIEVAECADLVKGYSGTYRRGVRSFDLIFAKLIDPAIRQVREATTAVRGARAAANADPEGDALDNFLLAASS
ncbi:indolepyruvate oxidoreductase subunit beta family protein [Bradyrhizobium pachyrhizi]|uniref:Indolepyruvate oxidoreductase subunit beta family protein n=1 Tax=Bradyrhizobium pachyrhizi TaxID=280333 RepID=A0A844SG28_9BRAD|nr:indolepyruvate oxidoreductase subunit beta family protein [Bradyrhizobium pachyrhizi]MVT64697.1 indolepyruvate oxidoreductase subunit beta family protein [Bradyrhizobium pachyrhizi]